MQCLIATHEEIAIITYYNKCKLKLTFSVSVNLAALSLNMALTACSDHFANNSQYAAQLSSNSSFEQ